MPVVTGPYKLTYRLSDAVPLYSRQGWWNGKSREISIFRIGNWYVGAGPDDKDKGLPATLFYGSCGMSRAPGVDGVKDIVNLGWEAISFGVEKAPRF